MTKSTDLPRIEEIFLAALELPPDARASFVRDRCGGDVALAAQVESLLASHESDGPLPPLEEERPFAGRYPERIAQYRIVRPLGQGGMGVVLLAVREGDGFEQTVALKLIHGGLVPPMVARRLEAERSILAGLEHPNIARLIDGGLTEDGRPYFAMEYVDGEDILTWADLRYLTIEARLRLFLEVCNAVHHAHQRLVVHRDLKPSNIMVTAAGRPKLLDFGIAKKLEDVASGEQTSPWITPAYASPEQATGEAVTTRSDVYSLGVLLCELLTGRRPHETTVKSRAELVRILDEATARRPSELVLEPSASAKDGKRPESSPEERAERRRTTPMALARRLRGEVDLIVLKALSREPERRYDSAWALAEDIRRHLERKPILARPDSAGYRLWKLTQRHRALSVTVVLLFLVLVGGVGGVAWQSRRAMAERDRAEQEASRARMVTALMTDIFRLSDPTRVNADTVGVRQVLAEGTRRVEETLADDPPLQATLLLELGRIYRNLGILDEADRLGRQALDLRERHEEGSLAHADALGFMGHLLRDRGPPDLAVEYLERAVRVREAELVTPDTALAGLLVGLGWEARSRGDHDEAGSLFNRALEIQRELLGEEHPEVSVTLFGLASTYHDAGSFDEAEDLFRTALERGTGRPQPVAATALVNLGMIRRLREQYVEAEPLLRSGYDMRLALFDPRHPAVSEAREQLGVDLTALGRYAEAEPLLTENLAVTVEVLGEEHEATRGAREAVATWEMEMGRYESALARLDTVVEQKIRAHGGDHPGTVYTLNATGDALLLAGRPDEAAVRYQRALEMGERLGGTGGVYGALSRSGMAGVAFQRQELDAALSLALAAESQALESLRPDHRYVLEMKRTRARILLALGRADEAADLLGDVLEGEERARPSPHPRRGATLALLGAAYLRAGDEGRAEDALRRAADEMAMLPPDHPEVRAIRERLRSLEAR